MNLQAYLYATFKLTTLLNLTMKFILYFFIFSTLTGSCKYILITFNVSIIIEVFLFKVLVTKLETYSLILYFLRF